MLRQKAISATLWSAADIFLRQGLSFIVTIVLARLLTPEEFGTIALLYLFIGVASVFVDSGFAGALTQRQDTTHTDESTVFWFNLVTGFLVAVVLWMAAPWFATFYKSPILTPLTQVLAINVFISALGAIHSTLLTKRLDFRTQLKIGAVATTLSGIVAIVMAMQGYGVWALALQALVSTLLTTCLLWYWNDWRPRMVFSLESLRRLFEFGGFLLLSGLLESIYSRIYTLLIGKFYSVRDLGFYNRADGTKQIPVGVLTSILSRVAFPIFSAAAHDKEKLQRGVRHALRGVMLINTPMMLGLMVTAEPVIFTLFGARWLPAAPILQVLCLAGLLWPLHVINLNVLTAQGHSRLFFRLTLIKQAIGIGLLVIGTAYGVLGIAWSQVAYGVVAFAINAHYTKVHLKYGLWQQTRDVAPTLASSIVMALFVHWVGQMLSLAAPLELAIQVLIGIAVFLGICRLFSLKAFREAVKLMNEFLSTEEGVWVSRFISPRKKTKYFCIGANKTGTTSVEQVFRDLGFKIGRQEKGERLLRDWAMQGFKRLISFSRTADAFQHVPFSLPFSYQILDRAFPCAKFILTVRDNPEQWFESLVRFHTYVVGKGRMPTEKDLKECDYVYPGWLWEYHTLVYGVDEATVFDKDTYINHYVNHNQTVVEYFKNRSDSLLVLNLKDENSMEKLLEFLGFEYKGQKMPHLNRSSNNQETSP